MQERLTELIARVTAPTAPGFYRTLYGLPSDSGALSVSSLEAWRALPFLTKQDLLGVALGERTFVPASEIDSFYASSGTTGSLPLFGPRAYLGGPAYRKEFHPFTRAVLSSIILPHMTERALKDEGGSGRVIALDPKNIRASVALAKAAGVDAILAHSFLLPLVCQALEEAGMATQIRYVELAGEPTSRAQYDYLTRTLPQATITPVYGAREVEGAIGLPCRPLGGEPLEVYHANPECYLELIDASGAVLEPTVGLEAELLITTCAEPMAFPLIRYRIGDMVRVVEAPCGRHNEWSFTVLGRAADDFIKIPGGLLRSDMIERVLRTLGVPSPEEFEARVEEDSSNGRIRLHLKSHLPPGFSSTELAPRIANELRVAPTYTYADGVRENHYHALVHEPLSAEVEPKKRRRLARM